MTITWRGGSFYYPKEEKGFIKLIKGRYMAFGHNKIATFVASPS
jgi:hypothetical protein